eukprot:7552338-Pyramimonas_sp.AAC.1
MLETADGSLKSFDNNIVATDLRMLLKIDTFSLKVGSANWNPAANRQPGNRREPHRALFSRGAARNTREKLLNREEKNSNNTLCFVFIQRRFPR